jgi:Na+/melibiose symporter-like transporter
LHAKARHVATTVAAAVNLTPLAPALTAWLAVAVAVHAAMAVAAVAEDLAAVVAVAAAVVVVVVVAAMAAAMVAVVRSAADQTAISNWHVGDRQYAGHRTSCPGCEAPGAWLPYPASWHATF